MKRFTLLCAMLMIYLSSSAQVTRVLFLGNSYTAFNNLPQMVRDIALANGDSIIFDSYTPGGYTFQQHSADANAIAKINSQPWDFVVLQEQSQRPSFPPAQVASQVYPYAAILDSLIRNNNPCSETVFYMTWGRKNGDASNCAFYPPLCTYDGMQARLRESYMEMTQDNDATVSPVGAAWKLVRSWNPSFDLYNPDESHPSVHGTYLAACVFYSTLFNKSTVGNPFTSSLSANDAAMLQSASHAVVIDSIMNWYEFGDIAISSFSYTSAGTNVQFQNHSVNAGTYEWSFGDGNSSVLNNPAHIYSQPGTYQVQLVADNGCKTDTVVQSVTTGTTGTPEGNNPCSLVVNGKVVSNAIGCDAVRGQFRLVDLAGREVSSATYVSDGVTLNVETAYGLKGIYLLTLQSGSGKQTIRLVF